MYRTSRFSTLSLILRRIRKYGLHLVDHQACWSWLKASQSHRSSDRLTIRCDSCVVTRAHVHVTDPVGRGSECCELDASSFDRRHSPVPSSFFTSRPLLTRTPIYFTLKTRFTGMATLCLVPGWRFSSLVVTFDLESTRIQTAESVASKLKDIYRSPRIPSHDQTFNMVHL